MANSQAKPIVEGGFLAAVSVALALASIYIPFMTLILPLPIALLGVRHGVRWSVLIAIVSALIVGIAVNITQGLFLLVGDGLVGVVLGECLRRGMTAGRTLAVGTISVLISLLVMFGIFISVMQIDLAQMNTIMQEMTSFAAKEIGQQMGFDEAQRMQIEAELIRAYTMMLPSGLFLFALFKAALNFIPMRAVMRRMKMEVPSFHPFESWRFPGWVLYLFILSLVGIYWGDKWTSDIMLIVSENVCIITSYALFVHGLALLRYAANRNTFIGRIWWLIVILAFVLQMFNMMLIILGGLDILMNYRKIREKRV